MSAMSVILRAPPTGGPLPLRLLDHPQVLGLAGGLLDRDTCLPALISRLEEEEPARVSANDYLVLRHPGVGEIVWGFSPLKISLLQGPLSKTEKLKHPIAGDTNLSVILGTEAHLSNGND